MARWRGRFRRRQQSTSNRKLPITDGEFENVPRELLSTFYRCTVTHDRASNEACHRGRSYSRSFHFFPSFPAPRKIFFAKLRQRFVKVAVISYSSDRCTPTFDVQTNRIDCCSGISRANSNEFFPSPSLSLFSSPPSFFVYNHPARRSRISRITRKRIIPRTKRSAKSAKRFFSLSSNKAIPFFCISLFLYIYICMYISRVALIQRIIGFL